MKAVTTGIVLLMGSARLVQQQGKRHVTAKSSCWASTGGKSAASAE